ncbi:MAG: hypothetical protein WAV55_05260 [Clostridiaceae bacterium]
MGIQVRNKIAHNTNIIDIKLRTKPKLRDGWKSYIDHNKNGIQAGRLAEVILIVVYFTCIFNNKYKFNELQKCINTLVRDDELNAIKLGFKDVYSSRIAIEKLGGYYSHAPKNNIKNQQQNFRKKPKLTKP